MTTTLKIGSTTVPMTTILGLCGPILALIEAYGPKAVEFLHNLVDDVASKSAEGVSQDALAARWAEVMANHEKNQSA